MTDYPFDTTGLCSADIDSFYAAYTALKSTYNIESTGQIDFHLEQFEVFNGCLSIIVRDSFVIKQDNNNDCYILFVESVSRIHGKAKTLSARCEYHIWGIAYMKHNFDRVLIRRETLSDKIIELVHPVEIDFAEDKPFSDTFYVLVNDYDKAINGIGRSFRNAVMDTRGDNFLIEIVEHSLIVGDHSPISSQKAVHIAEFITRVCSHC